MWEFQVDDLVNAGYRVISYDRRGFGKSSQPWNGYTYQDFADDLYEVICSLELSNVILVGFSMGGGELATYVEKYGTSKLSKLVFLSSVAPYMLKTDNNPDGVDGSVFEDMKAGIAEDRAGCRASRKATLDCIDAFGKTDFREGCKQIDIPTLVVHGDKDAIVPMEVSGKRAADIIPDADLKVIKGGPHGLVFTHNKELNPVLIDFFNKE
jgi:peroxiredoxin